MEEFSTSESNEKKDGLDGKVVAAILVVASIPVVIILCIALVVPILQLAFGAHYIDQCPINRMIPIYLIVSGACGIGTIVLTIVILLGILCIFKQDSTGGKVASGVIIFLAVIIIFLMSFFLFAWFIAGNVWIFSAKSTVQHSDSSASNYCHKTLYDFAFWILIVCYIMTCFSCCCGIFRSFFQVLKALKEKS